MAGYIITISDSGNHSNKERKRQECEQVVGSCVYNGVYSTILRPEQKQERNGWSMTKEGTFADYFTMRPGDHIYFFHSRMIFGIGRIVSIGDDCKYQGYLGAANSHIPTDIEYDMAEPLVPFYDSNNRCICFFEPSPMFFAQGVDMDEILNSNPAAFKMLRVLWKVSFIKVDDIEDQALMDAILLKNEDNLQSGENTYPYDPELHRNILTRNLADYYFNYRSLLQQENVQQNGQLKHEMMLEACLCDIVTHNDDTPFGHLDYVSHQVAASPLKPVDYIDKMDIWGYRYIPGTNTISKYVILELKKDVATIDVVSQIMKYVDFVTNQYAHGNYSMIEAYIVAYDFPDDVVDAIHQYGIRNYICSYRPFISEIWHSIHLVRYDYRDGDILLTEL